MAKSHQRNKGVVALTGNAELLNFAVEHGMIDIDTIRLQIEMNERKKYLEMHTYSIWQASDGQWKTHIPDEKQGRKTLKRASEKALLDALYQFYKEKANEPTIETVFQEWISSKLKYGEIRKQTYDRYMTDFDRYFVNNSSFKKFHETEVRKIDEEMLEDFIKTTIVKMELTEKAYSGMRILINGIFKRAKKLGKTDISITHFMGDLEISKNSFRKVRKTKYTEVYQDYEYEKLTTYLAEQKNCIRCQGLLLIFQTGVRIGELCGLKPEDVSKTRYVHIQRTEVKVRDDEGKWHLLIQDYTKSDAGERYIVTNEKAVETIGNIMRIRSDGEYLFMENGRLLHSNSFRRKLERVCKHLEIDYKSNHKIRKTYGTLLIDGGVDESIVAEQMGHADITTTKKYYYYSNKSEEKKKQQIEAAIAF